MNDNNNRPKRSSFAEAFYAAAGDAGGNDLD